MRKVLATTIILMLAWAPITKAFTNSGEFELGAGADMAAEPTWPGLTITDPTEAEFLSLMSRPEAPPMEYWMRLAHCETSINWKNEGKWGGAYGFFTQGNFAESSMGGWERFGGEQFSDHPKNATPLEQTVIAARTAFGGWYGTVVDRGEELAKRKGVPRFYVWDRDPFGYWTWGCAKRKVGDPCGYLYDGTVLAIEHAKPDYCRFLKPVDYTKIDGSMRYRHNENTRKAIAKSNAENAKSVAIEGATAWIAGDQLGIVKTVTPPDTAKCPAYWQDALDAGFDVDDLPAVDTIMWQQSKCNASKHNKPGDRLGLMQIHGDETSWLKLNIVLGSTKHLFEPSVNLRAAYLISRRAERVEGNPWAPWDIPGN